MSLIDHFQSFSFARKKRTTFSTDLHKHSTIELFYVLNGILECDIYAQDLDEEKEVVTLTSGQFIMILPHYTHRQHIINECEYMMCELGCCDHKTDAARFLRHEPFISRIPNFSELLSGDKPCLVFTDTQSVADSFSHLLSFFEHEEKNRDDAFRPVEYELLVYDLFFKISRCTQFSISLHYGNKHLHKAVTFINENYMKNISISNIAAYAGISPVYLQSLFKTIHGHPAFYFINQNRMKQAKKLLKSTTISVSQIALRIGYKSLRAFQFAFTKHCQMTPTEYREQNRKYFHIIKADNAVVYEKHISNETDEFSD